MEIFIGQRKGEKHPTYDPNAAWQVGMLCGNCWHGPVPSWLHISSSVKMRHAYDTQDKINKCNNKMGHI